MARTAASRHSRFGTTISVQLNPKKASRQAENVAEPEAGPSTKDTRSFVLHRQQAVTGDTGAIWDMKKRSKARKATTVDVLSRADNLSVESRKILQHMATEFIEACFNRTSSWSASRGYCSQFFVLFCISFPRRNPERHPF